jgi:uncharacterized protein (TIGR00369 family)
MRLVLMWDAEKKEVHIPFCPDETWCGYSGVVHGGILASVFDDAMAWAVHQNIGSWSVTADFHIRYRKPILVGRKYTAEGRVDETRGRKTRTKARIVDATGDIFAEADALFVSESRARSLSS